jgi:hypothetical protein
MTTPFTGMAIDDAAAALQALRKLKAGASAAELAAWCAATAEGLTQHGNRWLVQGSSWDQLKQGAAALSTAACLLPATRALTDADRMPAAAQRIRTVLHELAAQTLVQALSRMWPLEDVALDVPAHPPAQAGATADAEPTVAGLAHLATLDNIATYHREHERYYTVYKYERAAELAREANKLKVVADVWLAGGAASPGDSATDFSHPAFRAAGCADLNPLSAIASIGILFMEGQAEPAEIRALKAKLAALGGGSVQAGEWLAGMMAAAWSRESVLLDEKFAAAARPRYRTIATNWIGARETMLMGKLLMLAVGHLSALDFTPKAIRACKIESGQTLALAAAILGQAATLEATSGVELSGNDECWTSYRRQIANFASANT